MNKKSVFRAILSVCISAGIVSCTQEKDTPARVSPEPAIVKSTLPEPFHFHKVLEVKPGLTFDVLSWGRGSLSGASYMILRSDSAALQYRQVNGELDGKIADAWNMDLDSDGNPEVFIRTAGAGEGSYLNLYVHEFSANGSSATIKFPDLTAATKRKYRGLDSMYIKDGRLIREFPLFKDEDSSSKPTDGKKVVEYGLRNNTFQISEITDGTP